MATPSPLPTWQDAIAAFESAETVFTSASATQADKQLKFDAAKTALDVASADKATARDGVNSAIDTLIAVLTAAKLPVE